jgi:hypothetical protein
MFLRIGTVKRHGPFELRRHWPALRRLWSELRRGWTEGLWRLVDTCSELKHPLFQIENTTVRKPNTPLSSSKVRCSKLKRYCHRVGTGGVQTPTLLSSRWYRRCSNSNPSVIALVQEVFELQPFCHRVGTGGVQSPTHLSSRWYRGSSNSYPSVIALVQGEFEPDRVRRGRRSPKGG